MPIQLRCPLINPATAAQRVEAADPTSKFYFCGETGDLVTAPPCQYTKQTCTQLARYAGSTWQPEKSGSGREYISGSKVAWNNADTSGKYRECWPLWLGGTAWVECIMLNQWADANFTRGEVAVGFGQIDIQKVVVNGVALDCSMTGDYRWHYVNQGARDGTANTDAGYENGDPYGNCTVIQILAPHATIAPDSQPRVRVLGRPATTGLGGTITRNIVSATGDGGNIVVTLEGVNSNCAGNPPFTVTIEGNALANGTHTLVDWQWGPPGTITLSTTGTGTAAGGTVTFAYSGVETYSLGGASTPWVLAKALEHSRIDKDEIDVASFTAAAEICNAAIAYTDQDGNSATQVRFSSAVALREKRSAADIVRGLRQSISALLLPGADGKIKLKLEGPLAEQHPVPVSGSNYDTPIASTLRDGTPANGYFAYHFDESNSWNFRRIARPLSETPNRVRFPFSDPACDFAVSDFSVADSDDVSRTGQESPGGLQVEPVGIASQNHAWRAAKLGLAKIHRGNPAGDTRGTDWFQWEASFRGVRLELGDLVAITRTREGLTLQAVRITEIKPSRNYETVTLTGHWHSDSWYLDAAATDAGVSTYPYEPPSDVVLGDVQAFDGEPFSMTVTEDGTTATIEGAYDPPASIGAFCGITAHLEDPDAGGVIAVANAYDYDGDPAATAGTAERRGHYKLVYPQPTDAGRNARLYLTSRSQGYSKPLVFDGQTGESPNRQVALSQATSPLAAPDPVAPTVATLSVFTSGDQFGLRTGWTPADPNGGTVAYERQARYYSDNTATTPTSDWITLGAIWGSAETTADSGMWPKPTVAEYVRSRVRSINADGDFSAWVESSTPLPSVPTASGSSVPAPSDPTSPVVTVTDQDGNFGLTTAWTAPASIGSTVGYDREVCYYEDSGAITAVSDWIPLGSVGVDVVTADSGFWPRPADAQYVRFRIRAYNALDAKGAWVNSATPLPVVAAYAAPPTPATNESTIQTDVIGGIPSFRFHLVTTSGGGTTDGFVAYARYYSDISASTPTSNWIFLGWIDPANPTVDTDWWPLSDATEYVKVRIASQNSDNTLSSWLETAVLTKPASSGLTVDFTASGDVTAGTPYYDHDAGAGKTQIALPYTAPSPLGEFLGVYLDVYAPDQLYAPQAKADGTTAWDGTRALVGDIKPQVFGPLLYDATNPQPAVAVIDTPTYSMSVRLRLRSYSANLINETGADVVLTVAPPTVAKPNAATAHTQNPTGISVVTQADEDVGGKLHTFITFAITGIPTSDPTFAGYEIVSVWPDGYVSDPHTGILTDATTPVETDTPSAVTVAKFYARGCSIDALGNVQRNPIVPGETPYCDVTLGTTAGTVDLGAAVTTSIGTALSVVNGVLGVPAGGITESLIDTFAVSAQKIAAGAVETAKIADLSVITSKLAAAAVDTTKLADLAVTAAKLANGEIDDTKLKDAAVTTAKLAGGAVDTTKLAALAVEAANLANSSVTATKIANLAVGSAAIQALAVGTAHIADGAILSAKIGDAQITTAKIANAAVGTAAIANLAVGTAHLQNAAVTNAKIGNLAVSTAQIQDAAITTVKIQNLAVTNALIADAAITTAKIGDLQVTSAKIASLEAAKITAGTISASISMTSPTITCSGAAFTINLDSANGFKVTESGSNSYLQVDNASVAITGGGAAMGRTASYGLSGLSFGSSVQGNQARVYGVVDGSGVAYLRFSNYLGTQTIELNSDTGITGKTITATSGFKCGSNSGLGTGGAPYSIAVDTGGGTMKTLWFLGGILYSVT
ncbi:MAG: hypothetical protein ABFD60_10720 [Bryobacteraceae bacterium]